MSAPWPTRKLREIADIRVSNVDKKTYASEKPVRLCNYMDVYSNEYVTGQINFMEASATQAEIDRFGLISGDVVITKDSETPDDIGIPTVITEEIPGLVCGYHLAMIRPDVEQLDSIYLAKQLSTSRVTRYFSLHASGSTRYGLPIGSIESVEIPTPPKPEQTKIAEILSTVDQAIEQTEALIAKQQRLKTGLMQDLLTRGIDAQGNLRSEATHQFKDSPLGRIPVEWEFTDFGQILSQSGGHIQTGPFGSQLHSHEYVSEGVPVVMPQDINGGLISTLKIARITESRANALLRHRMRPGDLVFARRGDLSRCAVIHDSEEGWLCGTGCLLMRPPTKVLSPRWTAETYQFFTTQLQVEINAVGSTMPNLNTGILSSLRIALPSITEQERIEERLGAAERDETHATSTLTKLRSLKTALMQDLLTGRKRVTPLLSEKEVEQ